MIALFLPVGFLFLESLAVLSSISMEFFYLQLIWGVLGISVVALFWYVDWRAILNYRWLIWGLYGAAVLLLVIALTSAPVIRNTKNWIAWGPISFQPVELVKIALILVYARYFSRRHLNIAHWRTILTSFLYFAIPTGLVALQPDLGSALVLFGIWFGFLLVSGLPRRRLILTLVVFAAMGALLWQYGLKDYQRERIVAVFYPERNALGINYSVIQSKIAIGSAGFWGKGYGQGTQLQLKFLTEPEGDFIVAALVEEWGLFSGILTVGAFFAMVLAILRIGMRADRNFEKFICVGTVMAFSWQFFINAGSALGIFPVVGVTFPFLSYGGSSLLTSFFLVAIIHAIALRS